jgi:hypothetical protein
MPFVDDSTPEYEELTEIDQIVQIFKKVKYSAFRFKAMLFAHTYKEPCIEVLKQGEKIQNFLENIRKSEKFKRWLEYILTFGNYMNGLGFYGGAYGFKMDTLGKVCEVKTSDNTRSLFDYIIEIINKSDKDRELLDYHVELQADLHQGKSFIIN